MKISVIIPVYNGEDYIERAINCVKEQTFKDWEIVIIDDCSTDKTYEICKKHEADNIRIYKHDTNKGVGIARQTGLKEAKGEFVTFLDSDDYLRSDFLEVSLLLQQQHDSDVVYTSFTICYEKEFINKVIPAGDYIMDGSATVQLYYWNQIKFLTGKLIRKSLCDKVAWSDRRIGEDCQTLYGLLLTANKVRSSSYSGYVHIFRDGSLLANKPFVYCYYYSTLAHCDIINMLKDKYENTEDSKYRDEIKMLLDYEKSEIVKNHNNLLEGIKSGAIDSSEYTNLIEEIENKILQL